MVTLLRRHFSGATVEKLEQTFAVPAKFIAAAAQAYRRMYAKQSVQTQSGISTFLSLRVQKETSASIFEFWTTHSVQRQSRRIAPH
jgi:hypothetical protein